MYIQINLEDYKREKLFRAEQGCVLLLLLLIGGLAISFSFFPLVDVINGLLVTRILVQFMGQVGAVILLRLRAPELHRPFRMWLFPLPAIVALAGWIFLFSTSGAKTMLYAVGVISLGLLAFIIRARLAKSWPFCPSGHRVE